MSEQRLPGPLKPPPDGAWGGLDGALHHGGDLGRIEGLAKAFAGTWLDLSTGINPWPYPFEGVPAALWTRLPDGASMSRLRQAAARYYGVGQVESVAAAPGSQALIQWLPRLRSPGRVAILGPTYGEHAAAWHAAGHTVETVASFDALERAECHVAVATNPNNPDGRRLEPARLLDGAARLAARGGWLVVDEAFADPTPELSLASNAARPGLILLRSFGKFFGLAGLRLGFALCAPDLARRIETALGPWAVSGPAAWLGARALRDEAWIAAARRRLSETALRLDEILNGGGLPVVGGTALYRLIASPRAPRVNDVLLRHGIYARAFSERPDWLRFGLPGDAHAAGRLRIALAAIPPPLAEPEVSR